MTEPAADSIVPDGLCSESGVIREGKAEIQPNNQRKRKDGRDDVFYNPAQVFNRDLSVLMLSVFAKIRNAELADKWRQREERAKNEGREVRPAREPGLLVLEALAATGIRSIRYAKELGDGAQGIRRIVANDLDETAVDHIRQNIAHNQIREGRIEVVCGDAAAHMYTHKARGAGGLGDDAYDVIDIDPYGTAAPFLDAAVQGVADGGLLCITSTDMPVLGGNHPEVCFGRYGGTALKSGYVHEMALRLLMHAVSTSAAKYGRNAQPVACFSIDFYVRCFVRVFDSPASAKYQASKTSVVHQCVQCESFFNQPLGEAAEGTSQTKVSFKPAKVVVPGLECSECGGRLKLGGPFYGGRLFDSSFVEKALEVCESQMADLPGITSWKKIHGLLQAISEEVPEVSLYYRLPALCKGLKLTPVPLRQFRGTLRALGHRVSHMHREPEAIKTDAPNAIVYDLMRLWAEEHPPKSTPLPNILKKELTLKRPVTWVNEESQPAKKVPKFLPNPEANWGPRKAARGGPFS